MDADLRERQENEVDALKSIFGTYCIDLRTSPALSKVGKQSKQQHQQQQDANLPPPIVIQLTLFPQSSQSQTNTECHVQIDLRVSLTPNYPNELPKIYLENQKGLSIEQVKHLRGKLVAKANGLVGNEMIFDLCQEIQEYLYANNKPPPKSFFDQRLENQNLERQQTQFELEICPPNKLEDHVRAEIDQEIDRKRRLINEERKKEREKERETMNASYSPSRPVRASKNLERDQQQHETRASSVQPLSKSPGTGATFPFKPFQIKFQNPSLSKMEYIINCIKLVHVDAENSVKIYRGIEINTNEMFNVYEWQICLETGGVFDEKKLAMCNEEMPKMVEEFKRLLKLNNDYLLKYVAYNYSKDPERNMFVVQLCIEYLEGNSLDIFINQRHAILYNALKVYATQLVDTLDYLHSNNAYHRDLKASCVYLDKNGNIRLSEYGLIKRLNNLNQIVAKDAINVTQGNLKSDIHQLGLLLLSLGSGENITDYHPKIPTNLKPEFKSFLNICINETAPRREKLDCKYLRNHPFFSNFASSNDAPLNQNMVKRTISIHYEEDPEDYGLSTFTDYSVHSRLNTEFDVIGVVGEGAFGKVLKVKNKLDSQYYAIKRIRTHPNSNQNKQIQREIKLLSLLNHENVVRYYSTWVEKDEGFDDTLAKLNIGDESVAHEDHDEEEEEEEEDDEEEEDEDEDENDDEDETSGKNAKAISIDRMSSIVTSEELKIGSSGSHPNESSPPDDDDDESSSSSSSSGGGGLIAWSRKENSKTNMNDDMSSISSSLSSSHTSSSLSSAAGFGNPEATNADIVQFDNDLNSNMDELNMGDEEEFPNLITFKKGATSKMKPEETDDSVVFADGSTNNATGAKATGDDELNKSKSMKKPDNRKSMIAFKKPAKPSTKPSGTDKAKKQEVNGDRQYIYIQMEFCDGKTLKDLIANDLYKDTDRVWQLFREILQGLSHIHELRMIHRDLKPKNVLIDKHGHAKIGDFGLATNKFFIQNENISPNTSNLQAQNTGNLAVPNLLNTNTNSAMTMSSENVLEKDSRQLDSTSMSGAVGTALYVAPELLTPMSRNKYIYTQKVDIYSLGIVFYEMCFPFSTNMERIHVIQDLRKKEIKFTQTLNEETYQDQIKLIKEMLNHDPSKRPSARDLLKSDLIPRKAEEVALDELLQSAIANKQSTKFTKIIKSIFDQKVLAKDDASYDEAACKQPSSFRYLQIRELVHTTFIRIFQRYGGYMMSYPLLTPWNDLLNDFNRGFKLVDTSGLVVCLPYNHRVPFARYVARSGCNNIKRYYIGEVYQVLYERIKGLHPKAHMAASFDIVTTNLNDGLPEMEILSLINETINSFPGLGSEKEYKLIINHTSLLTAILNYCNINPNHHKKIYYMLTEYNKAIKSPEMNEQARSNWLRAKLANLKIDREHTVEMLVNFLTKSGDPAKIIPEMRNLYKSEPNTSKLARDALNQLKMICQNAPIVDFKIPIALSTSFVLPVISHPYEYSGFIFQVLVQKKKKKSEYDILASGGRYDKMISHFKTSNDSIQQCAIGVSFDFEKVISMIDERTTRTHFRNELAICSLMVQPTSPVIVPSPPAVQKLKNQMFAQPQSKQNGLQENNDTNTLFHQEIRNKLRLYKQLLTLNKNLNISTHIAHQKFESMNDADEYFKKYLINSYAYLIESMTSNTTQIFLSNSMSNLSNPSAVSSQSGVSVGTNSNYSFGLANSHSSSSNNLNVMHHGQSLSANQDYDSVYGSNCSMSMSPTSSMISNDNFLRVRTIAGKSTKFAEKKFHLNEFLGQTNMVIGNINSLNNFINTIPSNPTIANSAGHFSASMNGLSSLAAGGNANNTNSNAAAQLNSKYLNLLVNANIFSSLSSLFLTPMPNYVDVLQTLLANCLNSFPIFNPMSFNAVSPVVNSNNIVTSSAVSSNTATPTVATPTSAMLAQTQSINSNQLASSLGGTSSSTLNNMPQLNFTMLVEPSSRQQSNNNTNVNKKKLESQIIPKIAQVFTLFSTRTRIELIAIETPDNVIQVLANGLHLDAEESQYMSNWNQCLEKLNMKHRKQLTNFKLDDIIRDLRYAKRSKVFILYSLKSDQYKLIVVP